MIRKRNRMIMVIAVIAAVIVAVPISFYELLPEPNPSISVADGFVYNQLYTNFYKPGCVPLVISQVNSTAIISERGYPNSTLSLSIRGYEVYGHMKDNFLISVSSLT
jgi:hypothetical protein